MSSEVTCSLNLPVLENLLLNDQFQSYGNISSGLPYRCAKTDQIVSRDGDGDFHNLFAHIVHAILLQPEAMWIFWTIDEMDNVSPNV